jgi:hypothetical protein
MTVALQRCSPSSGPVAPAERDHGPRPGGATESCASRFSLRRGDSAAGPPPGRRVSWPRARGHRLRATATVQTHGVEMPDAALRRCRVTHKEARPARRAAIRIFDNLDMVVAIGEPMHRPAGPATRTHGVLVSLQGAAGRRRFSTCDSAHRRHDAARAARRLGLTTCATSCRARSHGVLPPLSRTEWIRRVFRGASASRLVGSANIWDEHGQLIDDDPPRP